MRPATRYLALLGLLLLGACAVGPPQGPSVAAMPPSTKPIEVFQQDDAMCRNFALQVTGYASPTDAANQSMVNSAVLGTVLGAAAGAAIGAAVGNPAAGAAIGAGSGLVLGSASGAGAAQYSAGSVQYAYDASYLQCMASRGNNVPQLPPQYAYGYGYGYPYAYPPYYAYPYFPVYISGGVGWGGGYYRGGYYGRHW
ncbi:MAG TPA: glycine zipper family protein [Stellaceae bacterium]|nr:glycine zipper family protein [Stellaceae bacterium]